MGLCIIIIFLYICISNKMHILQSLFYSTTALHVSGITSTHRQEHKITVTTASGTGLSVLWVAYATHNTLKPVPALPRKRQTTIRCNGYQML
jgi:hypothetical protein